MEIAPPAAETQTNPPEVVVHGTGAVFLQEIVTGGKHHLKADEPTDVGGTDTAPTPYDYLLAALGSCTSMTIGWTARKRKMPLEDIRVSLWQSRIHAKDCEECMTKEGMIHRIDVEISLTGPLTPEQHATLMQAAERCPVHRTLSSEVNIRLRSTDQTNRSDRS
jgi:uncharacterized OsmC-like protein